MSDQRHPFDPAAPMSRGITLLEASAGTGKTYNITNLVMRLVAEHGVRIERILVVTFTRAATAELRERVRQRLAAAIRALEAADGSTGTLPDPDEDAVMHAFASQAKAQGLIQQWRRRLMLAHESFDEAAISTIHGFCQKTLQQSAFESDLDFEAELVEDLRPLLEEIVDDFMARSLRHTSRDWYRYLRDISKVTRRDLLSLADLLERNPDIHVEPEMAANDAAPDPEEVWRACMDEFVEAWRVESMQAERALIAAYRAGKFRRKQPYNTSRPKTYRKAIDASLDTLARDFVDLKDAITAYGWSKVVKELREGEEIEPLALFFATQKLIDDSAEALKLRFVSYVRAELPRRKAERNLLSFDDLLRRLDHSLARAPDAARQALRRRIREDFDAALIDEFQDTDPVQWEIFQSVFGEDAWLYLVGDPKQAIYAFRGADVYTYLRAKSAARGRQFTLMVNWRSDQRYVDALNALFEVDDPFGEEGIDYVDVQATPKHADERLRFGPDPVPALELRFFPRDLYRPNAAVIARTWSDLPAHVAADVVGFLEQGPKIREGEQWRPVEPRDVAILVRRNREARDIQAALLESGVPAVITGAGSVFESREAAAVQRLLDAMLQPSSEGMAKAAWATVLFGVTGNALAVMDDAAWEARLESLHEWAAAWREIGFMRTLRRIFSEQAVPERLLARPDGERAMTNLSHVAELLHVAETRERLGPSALAGWLRTKRLDVSERMEEAELRLESDADAVTIVTVHRSKGLEYPVVFCPTMWDGELLKESMGEDRHLRFHADDEARTVHLDLRMSTSFGPKVANLERARREHQAENMRLLYVALTRAKHRCVVYWGAFWNHETCALASLLHRARGRVNEVGVWSLGDVDDDALREDLDALAHRDPGLISVVEQGPLRRGRWTGAAREQPAIEARTFARERIDRWWRRASYSSLTRKAGQREAEEASPEARGLDMDRDDAGVGTVEVEAEQAPSLVVPPGAPPVPLCDFPRGTSAGTFLHRVLELYDFRRVDDAASLEQLLGEQMPQHAIAERWLEPLREGLSAVLQTPLGGPLGEGRLCDVPRGDRLDEMEFEFPVAGGYELVSGRDYVRPRALADVFRRHRPPSPNLSADYLEQLGALGFGPPVRGFLAGAIDLVFRREVDGRPRWFVADYKSNWLGAADWITSTVHHYAAPALAHAMGHRHYYLQYHLYTVALHRYLRWRLPGYDYERDFGGVYYMFLRGMVGPTTPLVDETRHGVFFDRPPFALIHALDTLLADPQQVDGVDAKEGGG